MKRKKIRSKFSFGAGISKFVLETETIIKFECDKKQSGAPASICRKSNVMQQERVLSGAEVDLREDDVLSSGSSSLVRKKGEKFSNFVQECMTTSKSMTLCRKLCDNCCLKVILR